MDFDDTVTVAAVLHGYGDAGPRGTWRVRRRGRGGAAGLPLLRPHDIVVAADLTHACNFSQRAPSCRVDESTGRVLYTGTHNHTIRF